MTGPGNEPSCWCRFVGIDLETTGVDPATDRVIEVAAIRSDGGIAGESFESLIDPGCPIPADVTYLTGITDKDVRGAPQIEDVLPKLAEFVADCPVSAHHAPFDLAFLSRAGDGSVESRLRENGVFDTLLLSRVLVPRLPNHRLTTVASFFDAPIGRAHRAGDDARAVVHVLNRLLEVLGGIGPALLADMARLADPDTLRLIQTVAGGTEACLDPRRTPDFGPKSAELLSYDNSRRIHVHRTLREERVELDPDELGSLFDESGGVAAALPGYEPRREQVDMMKGVADAFSSGVHLMVEAGTGVGKSVAYLVPAIYWAVENGERVIVSTRTKNLQDQLFFKDIPLLEAAIDAEWSAALLKGRGNYLCLGRWHQILRGGLTAAERAELLPIVVWQEETQSGDISENSGFRQRGYLWSRISADGGPCEGSKCPMNDRCYLMKARRAAAAAHIVIVNHSLLFSDTETENRILGDYSYLICDEAHNVEAVATEHLGRRVNSWRARAVLDNLYRRDGVESGGVSDIALQLAGDSGEGLISAIKVAAERLKREVESSRGAVSVFFSALSDKHAELSHGRSIEYGKLRYAEDVSVAEVLTDEVRDVLSSLVGTAECAQSLADLVADSELDRSETLYQDLEYHARELTTLAHDLEFLSRASDPGSVFWLEVRTGRGGTECELRSAPVSITEQMDTLLYSRLDSLVLTSATMTVDSSFAFMMERLGLDLLPDWRVVTRAVGSPYDYDTQTLAVVAGYLPPPSSTGFNQKVAELLVTLARPAEGGTLALFTARASLDAVFKRVRDPLTSRGKNVLAQGHSGGASAILGQFEQDVDSVLLATTSFWEGVDVRGRSLEQLIIVKLPFPVPKDPIVEAHCERYAARGEDSFDRYMVPLTAIRLRQGFGRLIRSTTDRGVVIFLDSRLKTRRYGERLLDQLPTEVVLAGSEGQLLRAVGATEPLGSSA